MKAKDIFDRALTLEPGQHIEVPCYDKNQQDSMRVMLSRERSRLLDKSPPFDILIRSTTKQEIHFLILSKVPRISSIVVVDEDGTITSEELTNEAPAITKDVDEDRERMIALMRQDGMSDSEIEEALK